jgi:hypothetical protein
MGKLGQASEKRVRMRAGGRESQVTPCASRTPASGLTGGARSLARSGRSSNLTRGSAAHGRQARGNSRQSEARADVPLPSINRPQD